LLHCVALWLTAGVQRRQCALVQSVIIVVLCFLMMEQKPMLTAGIEQWRDFLFFGSYHIAFDRHVTPSSSYVLRSKGPWEIWGFGGKL